MATARLDDHEKSRIVHGIERIIDRALYNKQFPLEKEDIFDWLLSQLPDATVRAYTLLSNDLPGLTARQTYACDFRIESNEFRYVIGVESHVPVNKILIDPGDKHHADVLAWTEWYATTKAEVETGSSYLGCMVWSCTSVGQIKRLMPEEIMRFVPKHLLDFSEVIRRSRIPASFTPKTEELEIMMNILTLGSLSPEQRKGAKVWVEAIRKIVTPE